MWFYVKYISFNICDAEIIVFHWRDLCRQKWTDKKDMQKVKDTTQVYSNDFYRSSMTKKKREMKNKYRGIKNQRT